MHAQRNLDPTQAQKKRDTIENIFFTVNFDLWFGCS